MEALEATAINGDTCVEQVLALKNAYVDEKHERCRYCQDYQKDCYKPIKLTQIPIRFGRLANG